MAAVGIVPTRWIPYRQGSQGEIGWFGVPRYEREGAWSIGVFSVDTVEAWRKEYADPVEEMACGNVQPWGA